MESELVVESIVQALALLQQATALEVAGEAEQAVNFYSAVLTRLEEIVEVCPLHLSEIVRRNMEEIRRKMEIVRHSRLAKEQNSMFPTYPIQFVPMPCPVEEFVVPQSSFSRVFWLMRRLAASIQQGAYLTPHLYVSKEVWHQEGAESNVLYVGSKTKYLSSVCEALEALRSLNTLGDFAKTLKTLNKFVSVEAALRDTLDHDLGRRKEGGKPKKSMWGMFSRKMKTTTPADYALLLTWAVNALEQGQLIERWSVYFTQASNLDGSVVPAKEVSEVLAVLLGISKQFYSGMCIFLLQDVTLLVERYNEKSCKSALKILPVDPKLEGFE